MRGAMWMSCIRSTDKWGDKVESGMHDGDNRDVECGNLRGAAAEYI
jgi:hypothetical protein